MWDKKMYKKLCTPGQEVKEEVDRNKKRGNICYGREVKVTQLKNKNKKNKKDMRLEQKKHVAVSIITWYQWEVQDIL